MNTKIQQQALLGILGGMGPLATVDFLEKLTRLTPANCDQDHLPWITISQPGIPDRSAAIRANNDAPSSYLIKGVAWLAAQGVQLIVIPCNTSHFWFESMQKVSSVPILHIVDATIEALQRSKKPIDTVAILATRGTIQAGIYSERLTIGKFKLATLHEDEQIMVDTIIKNVKGGEIKKAGIDIHLLKNTLAQRGITTVILACTELAVAYSMAHEKSDDMEIIDTSLALATASLKKLGFLEGELI